MKKPTRRAFVKNTAAMACGICPAGVSGGVEFLPATPKQSDVSIERISCSYEEHVFRVPLKFALTLVDRATLLTVDCTVSTRAGKVGAGFGTMPLNYVHEAVGAFQAGGDESTGGGDRQGYRHL